MGRKEYRAHIEQAAADPAAHGVLQVGSKDAEIEVLVQCQHGPVTVTAVVDETSSYPHSHNYISIYVQDSAPNDVSQAIASLAERQTGSKTVFSLLREISRCLSADTDGDTDMSDSQIAYDINVIQESDEELDEEPDDRDFFGVEYQPPSAEETPENATYDNILPLESRNLVRHDLRLLKEAGFKVGVCGPLVQGHSGYLTSSCRISKLGISEEAMQAWQLQPHEYLILLIHYPKGYKHVGNIEELTSSRVVALLEFRFGVSSFYKPSRDEVISAFTTLAVDAQSQSFKPRTTGFRKLFISGALKDLFCEKFVHLLKCRIKEGMSWDGAMAYWHDHHSTDQKGKLARDPKYRREETPTMAYPELVTSDHISSYSSNNTSGDRLSFPLVAMQLYVRQVARCTEFCLVCYRKMPADIEAIKPYVCDSPLCLYQYLTLGFGPSIEHEIISQPKVVDLLVSLCWAGAMGARLKHKHLPRGLALRIPPVDILRLSKTTHRSSPHAISGAVPLRASGVVEEIKQSGLLLHDVAQAVRVNLKACELLFDKTVTQETLTFVTGDWIQLKVMGILETLHCKVEKIMLPTVLISKPITLHELDRSSYFPLDDALSSFQEANFVVYQTDLDSCPDSDIQSAIVVLLDLLPTVNEMREYLLKGGAQADLMKWSRIPASSLGLLRWIIASNRTCIMQIDDSDENKYAHNHARDDHVWGMPGWVQFRIAMGAPDKERRFINSVKTVGSANNAAIPTIFAWHGSSLGNWHSILREGLNFEETMNGRAFGHGVYLSKDLATSLGYSRTYQYGQLSTTTWLSSELSICDAISLNEIVNAPTKFVSSSPHFVINEIDWIQTRYLFVQTPSSKTTYTNTTPMTPEEQRMLQSPIVQDSVHFPVNTTRQKIQIPASATRSRATATKQPRKSRAVAKGHKKLKTRGGAEDPIALDDDNDSVVTDSDDREMLQMELERSDSVTSPAHAFPAQKGLLTDFVPGRLDFGTLEILPPPEGSAASTMASKRLQADLNAIRKVQNAQPLHELGWYVDPEHTENLYQWIVELHSFEAHLPLAKDMKAKDVKSVVLELTFGKDYPFAPPFVRVVRPRFLPFQQGGGGHVTAGGALCMELLTNDGWGAVNSIESVLMQVRLAMSSLEPRPARLDPHAYSRDYAVGEAIDAYIRACQAHDWTVPPGFKEMVLTGRKDAARYGGY